MFSGRYKKVIIQGAFEMEENDYGGDKQRS
jgi:hypothetical protein